MTTHFIYFAKFIGISCFSIGLVIAGGEGAMFPYVNIAGAGVMIAGMWIVAQAYKKGD